MDYQKRHDRRLRRIREVLEKHYPKLDYVDFDSSYFYKSFEPHETGDTIEHDGQKYTVLYGWEWWNPGVQVYCVEVQPVHLPAPDRKRPLLVSVVEHGAVSPTELARRLDSREES